MISSGISSKYFDMVCYLKREASSGPIPFEVQQNGNWNDNIHTFEVWNVNERGIKREKEQMKSSKESLKNEKRRAVAI